MSKEEKAPKEPKHGVGKVAIAAILAGKTNQEVFDLVKKEFPEAKTTMASVNWYRNKLRSEGAEVATSRELRAAGKPPKAAKKEKQKDPLA